MALSVQIDRLSVGSHHLDGQKISPPLKRRAEQCLSKHLSNIPGPFVFKFDSGSGLEPLKKVCRYHQHTGQLPRQGMSSEEESLRDLTTQKTIFAVNRAAIPGTNGHIIAGMNLADDTLSVTRNILNAIPSVGPDDPVVNHLGYYAAMLWTFFAVRELDGGITDLKRSKAIGDEEGTRRAAARVLSGGISTTAAASSLLGRVGHVFATGTAAAALVGAGNLLFGFGSLLSISASSLGVLRCHRFNERLNLYLENKNLTEVERLQGALQYLKDAISVTPEEKRAMEAEIDPGMAPEAKAKLLLQKIGHLTEVKVKHLKRRTSNKSLLLILTQANPLLEQLSQGQGVKEAAAMIRQIQKENRTKMALYAIGLVAALISFTALLTMTFLSAGALPFVLYGIAGVVYLGLSVYNVSSLLTKKVPEALKQLDAQSPAIVPLEASHLSL